jgi:endonuclease YncB( thermonuclease family)
MTVRSLTGSASLRRVGIGLLLVLLFAGGAIVVALLEPSPATIEGRATAADGDSLRINGERIRLLDIDAPELTQECKDRGGRQYGCGRMAQQGLDAMVAQYVVTCRGEGRDRYGRVLARCAVPYGGDLGAMLVAEGFAVADGAYAAEQLIARSNRAGIWMGSFERPEAWRRAGNRDEDGSNFLGWVRSIVTGG